MNLNSFLKKLETDIQPWEKFLNKTGFLLALTCVSFWNGSVTDAPSALRLIAILLVIALCFSFYIVLESHLLPDIVTHYRKNKKSTLFHAIMWEKINSRCFSGKHFLLYRIGWIIWGITMLLCYFYLVRSW